MKKKELQKKIELERKIEEEKQKYLAESKEQDELAKKIILENIGKLEVDNERMKTKTAAFILVPLERQEALRKRQEELQEQMYDLKCRLSVRQDEYKIINNELKEEQESWYNYISFKNNRIKNNKKSIKRFKQILLEEEESEQANTNIIQK